MNRIILRDFEERDVDFIYRSKNNRSINQYIVGDFIEYSYDDAVSWVKKCMDSSENYKFWAIAENNDFQSIIGWCGISNIDKKNNNALFHGITINNPIYQDSTAYSEACLFVLEYVFEKLSLNRLYTSCLKTEKFSTLFIESIFPAREGVLRDAFFKDGQYYDLLLYGILRNEYYDAKTKGLLDFKIGYARIKENVNVKTVNVIDLTTFVEAFKSLIQEDDKNSINPQTEIKTLSDWSSLFAVEMSALVENCLGTTLDMYDIESITTIEDLYNMASNHSGQTMDIPSWESYEGTIY